MQPTRIQSASTLLTYSLTTSPMPVQVSPSTTVSSVASLTFVVSCPRSVGEATVAKIVIALPVDPKTGPRPTDLAETAPPLSSASISSSGSDEWVVALGAAPGVFVFTPSNNVPVLVGGQSLTIEFNEIQVNTVVGTALLEIGEWAAPGTGTPPPVTGPSSGEASFAVAKFPYGFFAGNFTADQPMIANGQRPTLSWSGSTNATYKMLYENNPPLDVSSIRTWSPTSTPPSPVLTHSTTFILQVSAQVAGQTATIDFNITIEVDKPSLVANDLTVLTTAAIGAGGLGLNVNATGNVGIGTNSTAFALGFADVLGDKIALWGQSGNNYGLGIQPALLQIHSDTNQADIAFGYGSSGSFTETMRVKGNGSVGIGTPTPAANLDIAGRIELQDSNGRNYFKDSERFDGNGLRVGALWGQYGVYAEIGQGAVGGLDGVTLQNGALVVNTSGNVLIGGQNPVTFTPDGSVSIPGQLNVPGGPSTGFNVGCYFDREQYNNVNNTDWQANVSILAGYIVAQAVFAQGYANNSDERIKDIQGRSDGAEDLRTLLEIEITDFRYKDIINNGSSPHKKLIAQQVERIFPQAVSKRTDVVPDIYQPAALSDGWVELVTDLKKGERVRLIADKGEGVFEVSEVTDGKFRTDFKPEGDKVFVFGREVKDFRMLDYDAIAMLNVSATQQLRKEKDEEVKALRIECAELREANDSLIERLRILEDKMESVASLGAAKMGSNGNGRH